RLTPVQQEIIKEAAEASAKADREDNRRQTEELIDSLKDEGMQINEPDLEPFAEATKSVLEGNASVYGDLYDKMNAWRAEH
ncbi:MAG: C4-dicarboxylate ABC transporter substrate-binding protein, partial [Lachnospiraceae bacterium]|nr:C4-dicarboxylate ABC transporter substrate-binding protein [Lachnospiraceae bacterium]